MSLTLLREHGVLEAADLHFADRLGRLAAERDEAVLLAAALAANRVGAAHVCLDLAEIAGAPARVPEEAATIPGFTYPALGPWRRALEQSRLLAVANAPLILEGSRLYLRRYHTYETAVATAILSRVSRTADDVDEERLREGLRRLFPERRNPDWQRVAAAVAVLSPFTVIAGGPGTGKTWAVARILALLVEQALARTGRAPRIFLLAPTGKAAARLRESIRESRSSLPVSEQTRALLPADASTIHRALGAAADGTFRHDSSRPLVADVVVVDEASMVDLALMHHLLAAIPPTARLILLGDRDQLASVEAGSVLADLCGGESGPRTARFSGPMADRLRQVSGDEVPLEPDGSWPLRDTIVHLQESRRFADHPGIGRVAEAIRTATGAAEAANVLDALRSGGSEVTFREIGPLDSEFAACVADRHRDCLAESDPVRKVDLFAGFRVLCAHRRGPDGVNAVNEVIEARLVPPRTRSGETHYEGRALLVTRNDRATRLFNGDTGLVVTVPGRDGAPVRKAVFPAIEDDGPGDASGVRLISLARLPSVETAFAMTVHKSQGSEFREVVLVLPAKESPVVTRELLYTAVTRARQRVTILASAAIVAAAVATPTRRSSGLRERLTTSSRLCD